jgi:putative hydrolase of the HAD superfamily
MSISCVLFDLDGVIRTFDEGARRGIERRFGLDDGALTATAFDPDLIDQLVTGRISRLAWSTEVGRRLGAPEAARAWTADIGRPEPDVLGLLDELREGGYTASILTNGTDTIPAELAQLGIDQHVDAVFNSAEIGVAKPDPAAFRYVCRALGISPKSVFFTDDSPHKLSGAIEIGMQAVAFTGVASLRVSLAAAGVDVRCS